MRRDWLFIVPALVAFWASSALAAGSGCILKPLAQLPVTVVDRQPRLTAKINGVDTSFLVDSGAFFSSLSDTEAANLRLRAIPLAQGVSVVGIGGVADLGEVRATAFELGGATLHNVTFGVVHRDAGNLIGQNVLGLADTEYDLGVGMIRLMRPYGCGERPLSYWAPGIHPSSAALISLNEDQYPLGGMTVFVNGSPLRALLDTGSTQSVLTAKAADRLGLKTESNSQNRMQGVGRRAVAASVAKIDDLKLGDEEIKNTRLTVIDDALSLIGVDMILGADFFLSHHVYVAKSQSKVYFTYNGGAVFAPPQDSVATDAKQEELTDGGAYARRAAAHASRGDARQALEDYDRAVVLAPNEAEILTQRGLFYVSAGKTREALADFDLSLKLKPDQPGVRLDRAAMLIRADRKAEASTELSDIAHTLPKDDDLQLVLAETFAAVDRFDDAIVHLDGWIAGHPNSGSQGRALNDRCFDRALAGSDLPRALSDCNAALRLRPGMAAFLDSRGLVHLRMGDLDKAIADYDAALAAQPKLAWSLYGRGLAKLKKGDAAGGKADLAAATAISPTIAAQAAKHGFAP